MISIRDTVSRLERSHQLRKTAIECYVAALKGASRYAVELEDRITDPYRRSLERIAGEAEHADDQALAGSTAELWEVFKVFRDGAGVYIGNLRSELANSAISFEEILRTLYDGEGEQDVRLRGSLARLREISDRPECAGVRGLLLAATESIEDSLEQIRKRHQLTVSQFRVEIRLLHQRIDALDRSATLDSLSQLLTRTDLEKRIRDQASGFNSLLLLRVTGFRAAEQQFDSRTAADLAGAFWKRLKSCLPEASIAGRWGEEAFVATLPVPKGDAIPTAKRISESLAGVYPCLREGKTVRPSVQVSVAIVEAQPAESAERTLDRIREFFSPAGVLHEGERIHVDN